MSKIDAHNKESAGEEFFVDFGPVFVIPVCTAVGDDVAARMDDGIAGRLFLDDELLSTDDIEILRKRIKEETDVFLADIAAYIVGDDFKARFEIAMTQTVATYRGTVLRKGIPNRETRRARNRAKRSL